MAAHVRMIDENVCPIIDRAKAEKDPLFGFKMNGSAIPADTGNIFFDLGEWASPGKRNNDTTVIFRAGLCKKPFVCFVSFGEKLEIPFTVQILPAASLTFRAGKFFFRNAVHVDASIR